MKSCKTKYASKGLPKVPGKPKGTDIVPAWLTPGEAILSPQAAEMLGRGNVQRLNQLAMRLGSPQYKALGDDKIKRLGEDVQDSAEPLQDGEAGEMEAPDYGMMGNQRADEIMGNPDQFNSKELKAAQRYTDSRGLGGGPSQERDLAFLQGTRSLEQVNNPPDEDMMRQYGMAQNDLFGRKPQYFMNGGMVQPGYYALGTSYTGMESQNALEDQLRKQNMGRPLSDSRALVPAGPRISTPTGSVGPGQGIRVDMDPLGNRPARMPAPPVPSMTETMSQSARRMTDPLAAKMAQTTTPGQVPGANRPPQPGALSRLGSGVVQNINTIPSVMRSASDMRDIAGSDVNPVIKGLAGAESVGNAAIGALADRLPRGRTLAAIPGIASGYQPITKTLGTLGVQTPLAYIQGNTGRAEDSLGPRTPGSPMTDVQTQRFIQNPSRKDAIMSRTQGVRPIAPPNNEAAGMMDMSKAGNLALAKEAMAYDPNTQSLSWMNNAAKTAAQRLGNPVNNQPPALDPNGAAKAVYMGGMRMPFNQGDFVSYKDSMGILRGGRASANGFTHDGMQLGSMMEDPGMRAAIEAQNSAYANNKSMADANNVNAEAAIRPMQGLNYLGDAMYRAGSGENYSADAAQTRAVLANPEKYAGRLGSGAGGATGMKLEKYAGQDGTGEKFALFNPADQSLTEIQPRRNPVNVQSLFNDKSTFLKWARSMDQYKDYSDDDIMSIWNMSGQKTQ